MSTLKTVLDVGLDLIPGVGKAISAGLGMQISCFYVCEYNVANFYLLCQDMVTTAAQTAAYLYDKDNDPGGAFEWWLSPCGGTDLVPDDIKKAFDILSQVATGVSSFAKPKNLKPGSGKKGDEGNPRAPVRPRPANNGGGVNKPKRPVKCRIPPAQVTRRFGATHNTLRVQECVKDKTVITEMVITTVTYAQNARTTQVTGTCKDSMTQACYHYSSDISVNPQWATITCPPEAAGTEHRQNGRATAKWDQQHDGDLWVTSPSPDRCERDEYPPAYLLNKDHTAIREGGKNTWGQLVRYLPGKQNGAAGQMWKGACLGPALMGLSDQELARRVVAAPPASKLVIPAAARGDKLLVKTMAAVTVDHRPEFTLEFEHAGNLPNHGLNDNPCWPSKMAGKDPGFVLLTYDRYYPREITPPYDPIPPPYNYNAKYVAGSNGD